MYRTLHDGHHLIIVKGYPLDLRSGLPLLPSRLFLIAVPPNARVVNCFIERVETVQLPWVVNPPIPQYTIRALLPNSTPVVLPSVTISRPYPEHPVEFIGEQLWQGFRCYAIRIWPVQWDPQTKQVTWIRRVTIRMLYEPWLPLLKPSPPSIWDSLAKRTGLIVNYEQAVRAGWRAHIPIIVPGGIPYANGRRGWVLQTRPNAPGVWKTRSLAVRDEDAADILVVVSKTCAKPFFDEYVPWRAAQGLRVNVTYLENIFSIYAGGYPERIRNFIIDAYNTWGGRLKYVILAYDVRENPEAVGTPWWIFYKGYYVGTSYEPWAPTDLPFGDLNSNYDVDQDGYLGDPEDVYSGAIDYTPEVFVGRIPVNNLTQAQQAVHRIILFEGTLDRQRDFFAGATLFVTDDGPSVVYFIHYDYVLQYIDEKTPWSPLWDEPGCTRIYDGGSYGYNYTSGTDFVDAWNAAGNHCLTFWNAHGAPTGIQGGFSYRYIPLLRTLGGLVWASSCYTGSWHNREFYVDYGSGPGGFHSDRDSLAECMLAMPKTTLICGGIGYVGASAPAFGLDDRWIASSYNHSASAPNNGEINYNIDDFSDGMLALTIKLLFQVSYNRTRYTWVERPLTQGEAFWFMKYYFYTKDLGHSGWNDQYLEYYCSQQNIFNLFGDPVIDLCRPTTFLRLTTNNTEPEVEQTISITATLCTGYEYNTTTKRYQPGHIPVFNQSIEFYYRVGNETWSFLGTSQTNGSGVASITFHIPRDPRFFNKTVEIKAVFHGSDLWVSCQQTLEISVIAYYIHAAITSPTGTYLFTNSARIWIHATTVWGSIAQVTVTVNNASSVTARQFNETHWYADVNLNYGVNLITALVVHQDGPKARVFRTYYRPFPLPYHEYFRNFNKTLPDGWWADSTTLWHLSSTYRCLWFGDEASGSYIAGSSGSVFFLVDLRDTSTAYLLINTSWQFSLLDYGEIAVSQNGEEWIPLVRYRGWGPWRVRGYNLTNFAGSVLWVRLYVSSLSPEAPESPAGWFISRLSVVSSITQPSIRIIYPSTGIYVNTTCVQVTWSVRGDASGVYQLFVNGSHRAEVYGNAFLLTNLTEGWYTLTVVGSDPMNSTVTASTEFGVDLTPPSLLLSEPINGSSLTSPVCVVWNGSDKLSGVHHYSIRIDSGDWIDLPSTTTSYVVHLKPGNHTIWLRAVDCAGNIRTVSVSVIVRGPSFIPTTLVVLTAGLAAAVSIVAILYVKRRRSAR